MKFAYGSRDINGLLEPVRKAVNKLDTELQTIREGTFEVADRGDCEIAALFEDLGRQQSRAIRAEAYIADLELDVQEATNQRAAETHRANEAESKRAYIEECHERQRKTIKQQHERLDAYAELVAAYERLDEVSSTEPYEAYWQLRDVVVAKRKLKEVVG